LLEREPMRSGNHDLIHLAPIPDMELPSGRRTIG
jgi:hypothetical protein